MIERPPEPPSVEPRPARNPSVADRDRSMLSGRDSRWTEFWRAARVFAEFIRGYRAFHFLPPAVTVFGSARFAPGHRYYELAREMGRLLGRSGFTVMTGGGPGIMEAANRGAREVGASSVGCNIVLPKEQSANPYVDKMVEFDHFYVRKVMLVKYSYAFVAMPGGFGTMDEIFETATLMQTGKIERFPVVLMGVDYWQPLVDFVMTTMRDVGTISPDDGERLVFTDSPEEAMAAILERTEAHFGVRPRMQHAWEQEARP